MDEDILQLGLGPASVEVDLMQPLDPNRSPKVNIPPLNHIGLWVDNLHEAVAELTEKGMRFTPGGIRRGAGAYIDIYSLIYNLTPICTIAGHDVIFIHPKAGEGYKLCGEGVLIELVQAPESVLRFHQSHDINREVSEVISSSSKDT